MVYFFYDRVSYFVLRCSKLNLGRNCGFVSIPKRALQTSLRNHFQDSLFTELAIFTVSELRASSSERPFLRGRPRQSSYPTTKSIARLDLRSARLNARSCLLRDHWSVLNVRYGPFTNWFRLRPRCHRSISKSGHDPGSN